MDETELPESEENSQKSFLNYPPASLDCPQLDQPNQQPATPTSQPLPSPSVQPPTSFALDSTADTFSPSSTSTSSSFHQRATGYRHSFHRRHNSARQRGHAGGNYPSYYNYKYDDSFSSETLNHQEEPSTLKLPSPVAPPMSSHLQQVSKTPSPKPLAANATRPIVYYDNSLQNNNTSSARNSFNLPVSNNNNNSSSGGRDTCEDDDFSTTVTQRHNMALSRNRDERRKSCCYSQSNCHDDRRRYSSSSIASRDGCCPCCCDMDDDMEDDVKCRGAGFCGSVCTKTFLITINLTFFVLGWTLMAGGVWVHIYRDSNHLGVLLRDNPTSPLLVSDRIAVFLIVSGAAVSMIGFLGCCGACTESVCFLGFYAVLLVVFIISQVIFVVLASNFQETVEKNLARSMLYQVKNEYNVSDDFKLTFSWDKIQSSMQCCGAIGPLDYHQSAWFNSTTDSAGVFVPTSCCKNLRPLSTDLRGTDNPSVNGGRFFNIGGEGDFAGEDNPPFGAGGLHGSLSSSKQNEYNGYYKPHYNFNERFYQRHRKRDNSPSSRSGIISSSGYRRGKRPRSSSTSAYSKDYLCQLEAMRLQFPNNNQDFLHVHTQGCHAAVIELAKIHAPALTCIIFLDVLQVINLFYACVLIGIVRKKHSDYSWCEEEERI